MNQYRVEEFKRRIQAGANNQLTFTGIGLDVGFNSKATFYQIFKKQMGVSSTQLI